MTAGAFPLLGVGKLPNVTIAHPGEVWSNRRANGNIVPGAACYPVAVGGKYYVKQVTADDTLTDNRQVAVAMRQVEIPDVNIGPLAKGPNEIVNQLIASGDYLRTYHTGVLHLTLVEPRDDYEAGQIVSWDSGADRPAGKAAGTGAWTNQTGDDNTDLFEVFEWRPYGTDDEGILTVRFLRGSWS